jgi:hypothetical protein
VKERIIELWEMVGNHNLYAGEKLVIDWNKHDKGFDMSDVVALCREGNIFWVESATHEEAEELFNFYK